MKDRKSVYQTLTEAEVKTYEKLFRKLYRMKGLPKSIQEAVDTVALEVIGEGYVWPTVA